MLGVKNSTMLKCYEEWCLLGFSHTTAQTAGDSFGKAAKSKITEGCCLFLCPLLLHGHSLLCLVLEKHF